MCLALEYTTEQMANIVQNVQNERERLGNIVHQCDLKTSDLLHEVELSDIKGVYYAYLIIKELKKVRKLRRKAKDDLIIIEQIEPFVLSQKKKFEHVISTIDKITNNLDNNRHYNIRVQGKIQDYV